VNPLLQAFVELCLLRRGPQDLPASPVLLALTVPAYLALDTAIAALDLPVTRAFGAAVLDAGALAAFTALALAARGRRARLLQTLTALLGSGVVLGACALPVGLWLRAAGRDAAVPQLLWLTLFVWSIAVSAHIYRHALEVHYAIGVAVSVMYVWLLINIAFLLLGPPPA